MYVSVICVTIMLHNKPSQNSLGERTFIIARESTGQVDSLSRASEALLYVGGQLQIN